MPHAGYFGKPALLIPILHEQCEMGPFFGLER